MKKIKVITYLMLWIAYIGSTFALFPLVKMSCVIPVIPLIGLGTWLFGRSTGLYAILLSVIHNFFLTGIVFADEIISYQYKLTGYLLLMGLAFLTEKLRRNFEAIKATRAHLDTLVENRADQLSSLTDELLSNSENLKNSRGQKLHDGMGQQLTGIQLLSASLSEQLLNEGNATAAVAHHLRCQASTVHDKIRRISRLLFPVRIGQVGLVPALNELSDCISEIKPISMQIAETENLSPIPDQVSLQLYRICQETTLDLIDHHKADRIDIEISHSRRNYHICIKHNGSTARTDQNSGASYLIEYRLKQIDGIMKIATKPGNCQTEYTIPNSVEANGEYAA